MPNQPNTNRLIRIEDIDRGVKGWFEQRVSAYTQSPQGDRRKVPFLFAAGERWVAAVDRKGIRDRDGRLILPVIQVRRMSISRGNDMTALGVDVPRMQIARLISEKTSALRNLDSSRPISQRSVDPAVYEIYTVPFPRRGTANYKVLIQAQYQTQVNDIIEKIEHTLDFTSVPSFVIGMDGYVNRDQGVPTGDGSTERAGARSVPYDRRQPLSNYYSVGFMDGDFSDRGNSDEFTDQERIIQVEFGFKVPIALMLDPEGSEPAVQVERTAFKVSLGSEQVHIVDDPEVADRIFGRKK